MSRMVSMASQSIVDNNALKALIIGITCIVGRRTANPWKVGSQS